MLEELNKYQNLDIVEGAVEHLIIDEMKIKGIRLSDGREFLQNQ